jgi:hypothetical protein
LISREPFKHGTARRTGLLSDSGNQSEQLLNRLVCRFHRATRFARIITDKGDDMKTQDTRQKMSYLFLGISIVLAILMLTGAATIDHTPQIGRYRLTAVVRGNFPDLFVIDTATGAVKWVGDDEGKPFDQIKGR